MTTTTNGSTRIFKGAYHRRTSHYGEVRTSSIHKGTDYGTSGKALPQYPPLDGAIVRQVVTKESNGDARGCRVRMEWPDLNLGMILQHLVAGSIPVKVGQTLTKDTKIGLTGMTGKYSNGKRVSTGVHAHVEVYYISQGTGATFDFETLDFDEIEKLHHAEEKESEEEMKYTKLSEVPDWGKAAIQKGIENGYIALNSEGLFSVWESNLQVAVWFYAKGLWDEKVKR